MNLATRQRSAFRFRGRSFLALVLTPELPVGDWLAEVDRWLSRAPGFFAGKPLVLDVAGLSLTEPEFIALISELAARKIQLLGVEGAEPSWQRDGLPPLLMGGRAAGMIELPDSPAPRPAAPAAPAPSPAKAASALLIDKPVRSGQSIVNPDGDVTIVGSVASGAEIVAAGSIHVYGALRGRALAGMYGDGGARIFCRRLEAELLAIDGYYKVADELEPHLHKKPIHARLERGIVQIITLD